MRRGDLDALLKGDLETLRTTGDFSLSLSPRLSASRAGFGDLAFTICVRPINFPY